MGVVGCEGGSKVEGYMGTWKEELRCWGRSAGETNMDNGIVVLVYLGMGWEEWEDDYFDGA